MSPKGSSAFLAVEVVEDEENEAPKRSFEVAVGAPVVLCCVPVAPQTD